MKLIEQLWRCPVPVGFGQRGGGGAALDIVPDADSVALNVVNGTGDDLPAATSLNAGAMTAADKVKLDGLSGTQIATSSFDSRAQVTTTSITDPQVIHLRTAGYAAAGDGGGAHYVRTGAEPSHAGKIQSADGAWWEIVAPEGVNVTQFGAVGDGVADDAQAINDAIAWAEVQNGATVWFPAPPAHYRTGSTINLRNRVRIEFHGATGISNSENFIRPTAAVTIGVYADLLRGFEVNGLSVDMSEMADGSSGITSKGCWHATWRKCAVFGINQPASKCWEILSTPSQGNYWTLYEQPWATGSAGTGYYLRGESTGAKRLTSQQFISSSVTGVTTGWNIEDVGTGIILLSANVEGCGADGVVYNDNSTGTYLTILGGEISSNGGWGITGNSPIWTQNVVISGNSSGNADANTYRQEINSMRSGELNSYFAADRFLSKHTGMTLAASDTIRSDFGFIRVSGSGGPITLTSNPQIANPTANLSQLLVITGGSNTNTVTFVDGNGLRLANDVTLALDDALVLAYSAAAGDWVEVSRMIHPTRVYTPSNVVTARSLDANAVTIDELADVVGTLIADLQAKGLLR